MAHNSRVRWLFAGMLALLSSGGTVLTISSPSGAAQSGPTSILKKDGVTKTEYKCATEASKGVSSLLKHPATNGRILLLLAEEYGINSRIYKIIDTAFAASYATDLKTGLVAAESKAIGMVIDTCKVATSHSVSSKGLSYNSLDTVSLTGSKSSIVQGISRLFGKPTSDYTTTCGGGKVNIIEWGDLIAQLPTPGPTTGPIGFSFGYVTGGQAAVAAGHTSLSTSHKPEIRTTKGVTLGSTVSELKAAYPTLNSRPGDGYWFPATGSGTLSFRTSSGIVWAMFTSDFVPSCSGPG